MAVRISHSDHLRADGLSVAFGDRHVFADLSFSVAPGRRLGLIGENGAGKSTLLRLLAGHADTSGLAAARIDGRLARPARIGLLAQELPFLPDERVDDVLEAALAPVRAIERELDAAAKALADGGDAETSALRYSKALAAAERADVWSAEVRRDELLDGLGVAGLGLDRRIGDMSGGQRSRFALAAVLLSAPDALLLDEPTNHLDDDAAAFLEARLRAWRGPVVFASHDREFLDRVATGLLDLDPGRAGARALAASGATPSDSQDALASAGGTVFGGGFSDYLAVKADEREQWRRQHEDEQEELRRLRVALVEVAPAVAHARPMRDKNKMAYVRHGARVDRQVSRRIRNAELRLEMLEREQVRKPPAPLSFGGIPAGSHALDEASGLLVQLAEVIVDDRLVVDDLRIAPLTRLLVTGPNGAGKSTLLSVLAGRLAVDAGAVHRRRGLRVGLLEQDVRFSEPDVSPRAIYERMLGGRRAEQVPLTGLGLLAPRELDRPIGRLSIGQQRRLALALVIARPPHVFLLDEPTNHLSLGLASELESALGTYPGAIVIASHDRWLRRHWEGESLELRAERMTRPLANASA